MKRTNVGGKVTGTLFYRARYYQATIGRFLQEDPVGFRGGINLYGYVHNYPTEDTDPTGLAGRKRECEKLYAELIGMLKHGKHHQETGQSQRPICFSLQRILHDFQELDCGVYYGHAERQAQNYLDKFCRPPNCPQGSPAADPAGEPAGENTPYPEFSPIPVPVMPLPPFPFPFPEPIPLPVPVF